MNTQVEKIQEQLQQAALNLNQLHMTSKDYGKNIVCVCVCVYISVIELYKEMKLQQVEEQQKVLKVLTHI